jgi:hypothetical protein
VIAIDEVLERRAKIDPRQSRLIELRFFGDLNVEESKGTHGSLHGHYQNANGDRPKPGYTGNWRPRDPDDGGALAAGESDL